MPIDIELPQPEPLTWPADLGKHKPHVLEFEIVAKHHSHDEYTFTVQVEGLEDYPVPVAAFEGGPGEGLDAATAYINEVSKIPAWVNALGRLADDSAEYRHVVAIGGGDWDLGARRQRWTSNIARLRRAHEEVAVAIRELTDAYGQRDGYSADAYEPGDPKAFDIDGADV